ncbi:MAG: Rieske (2Fe-2S) protein [Chloroflexi bacterium]|nr:Rieske (2Fe-2S) protein [Chloroflexota bacterium]
MLAMGPFAELESAQPRVVSAGRRAIVLFVHAGCVYALDNRRPHMGFPLNRGTLRDGILTCHWHHARFDLAGGCTFDPFADDVAAVRTELRDGVVWLNPTPLEGDRRAHWSAKLPTAVRPASQRSASAIATGRRCSSRRPRHSSRARAAPDAGAAHWPRGRAIDYRTRRSARDGAAAAEGARCTPPTCTRECSRRP